MSTFTYELDDPHRSTPNKFSADAVEAIIAAKRQGKSNAQAARDGGISTQSLYTWLKKGEAGEKPFTKFVNAFRKAETQARNDQAAMIMRRMRATVLVSPADLLKDQ